MTVEDLVRAHGQTLFRLAVMLTGTAADGEDLLQTTLVRLLRSPAGLAARISRSGMPAVRWSTSTSARRVDRGAGNARSRRCLRWAATTPSPPRTRVGAY